MNPPSDEPYIATGRIIKPYGVKGWVKVASLSSNPERFRTGNEFMLEGSEWRPRLRIEEEKEQRDALLIKFEGIEDREAAAKLSGKLLLVRPEELGECPEGAFWEHQLLGLEVETSDGRHLGEATEMIETGANDVLVVAGEKEYLIPLIEDVIERVDLERKIMVIRPVPGLLEE